MLQHNLFCDNCHSHVARAMNLMQYNGSHSWNMVKLWFYMILYGKYVRYKCHKMQHTCIVTLSFIHYSFTAILKTWLPFLIVLIIVGVIVGCSVGITHS